MNRKVVFLPQTRPGLVLHIAAILLLLIGGIFGLPPGGNAAG